MHKHTTPTNTTQNEVMQDPNMYRWPPSNSILAHGFPPFPSSEGCTVLHSRHTPIVLELGRGGVLAMREVRRKAWPVCHGEERLVRRVSKMRNSASPDRGVALDVREEGARRRRGCARKRGHPQAQGRYRAPQRCERGNRRRPRSSQGRRWETLQ